MNQEPNESREQLEVRVVALLLGEASSFGAAELEAAMQKDAALAAFHAQMRRTIDLVGEASKEFHAGTQSPAAQPKLSPERRQALLARFQAGKTPPPDDLGIPTVRLPRRRTRWLVSLSLTAAFVVLATLLSIPHFVKSRRSMAPVSLFSKLMVTEESHFATPEPTTPTRDLQTASGSEQLKTGLRSDKSDGSQPAGLARTPAQPQSDNRRKPVHHKVFLPEGELGQGLVASVQNSGEQFFDVSQGDFFGTSGRASGRGESGSPDSAKLAVAEGRASGEKRDYGDTLSVDQPFGLDPMLSKGQRITSARGGRAAAGPLVAADRLDAKERVWETKANSGEGSGGIASGRTGYGRNVRADSAQMATPEPTVTAPGSSSQFFTYARTDTGASISEEKAKAESTQLAWHGAAPDRRTSLRKSATPDGYGLGLAAGNKTAVPSLGDTAALGALFDHEALEHFTFSINNGEALQTADETTEFSGPVSVTRGVTEKNGKESTKHFSMSGYDMDGDGPVTTGGARTNNLLAIDGGEVRGLALKPGGTVNAWMDRSDLQGTTLLGLKTLQLARDEVATRIIPEEVDAAISRTGNSDSTDAVPEAPPVAPPALDPVVINEIMAQPQKLVANKRLADSKPAAPENQAAATAKPTEKGKEAETDLSVRPTPSVPPTPQPEIATRDNPFSTFSLNVSDVSFKLASASLQNGALPDPASIRVEEFVNAFNYRDPAPAPGARLAFAWERARYPFAHNRDILRFSIQTAALGREPQKPMNLVILLDNSGSMERPDRVHIAREALQVLAHLLQPQDRISVIAFSRTARLWVDGLAGGNPKALLDQVLDLNPQGGTNLEEALKLAYATATRHFYHNGVNRVILLTDGAANLGNVEPEVLQQAVVSHRAKGIALDCFGIGWEGYNDDLLEVLTRNGDGRYGFLNRPEEAGPEFAQQLAGALHVAAADVKTQIEFNPRRVTHWRQIGYAKHQLTKEQFRDNTVDAAEIAAAESGNALYVVQVNPRGSGPLGVVRVRFKVPRTGEYLEQEWELPCQTQVAALDQARPATRLAVTAAAFGEWLSRSPYAGEVTLNALPAYLNGVPEVYGPDPRPERLGWMIRQAQALAGK